MPLVYGKELLKHAVEEEYAIPAFGFVNLEGAIAIVRAAEEMNAPIIMQTTQGGIDYAGHAQLAAIAISLAKEASVPIALHLDHGRKLPYHEKSIELGYTSLMIDGSTLSLEENIAITNNVCGMIKDPRITIEAELGKIGGKEDDMSENESPYTKVDEAVKFINETNIDMLAIACGTSHGFYVAEPHINQELIQEISKKTGMPLVLHGGTGVPLDQVTAAVESGVRKANFDSELKQGLIDGIMDYMGKNPKAYDLRKINEPGILNAKQIAINKIKAVKADNKNWL